MKQKIDRKLKFNGLLGLAKMVMRKEQRISDTKNVQDYNYIGYQRDQVKIQQAKTGQIN